MTPLVLLALLAGADPKPGQVRVEMLDGPARIEVRAPLPDAAGKRLTPGRVDPALAERWLRLVLVDPADGTEGPPILGTYLYEKGRLRFRPRHALLAGQRYRAVLSLQGGRLVVAEHAVPMREASPPAVVERIYPTAAEVPANLLKLYLHFSRPMRETRTIFDHLHLIDEKGEAVLDPWRRTELWSADGRRLTLWVHPGRVKEGVNLREELGPVLRPGREYTLVIDAEIEDARGQPLGRAFTKKLRVTDPLRTRPVLEAWKVEPPAAKTREPLVVRFPRPLDRALLERFLEVVDARGEKVPGAVEVTDAERTWRFTPARPWSPGEHRLRVDGRLEDLAGNTPLRVFDLDLDNPDEGNALLHRAFRPR